MTLSQRIAALQGPDRAVNALRDAATFYRWLSFCLGCFLTYSGLTQQNDSMMVGAVVFFVGSGIAHLFALLSAALKAGGL